MLGLITGGSGSGKSAYAEQLCVKLQGEKDVPMLYVATMYPFDEEAFRKIERHRKLRKDKNFDTLECFTGLEKVDLPHPGTTVLLECMSNLTANEMYQEDGAATQTVEAICRGLDHLCEQAGHVVVVSNEIFSDGMDYDDETRRYQQYLGRINQYIADKADLVVEVVYGIPLVQKGEALI